MLVSTVAVQLVPIPVVPEAFRVTADPAAVVEIVPDDSTILPVLVLLAVRTTELPALTLLPIVIGPPLALKLNVPVLPAALLLVALPS